MNRAILVPTDFSDVARNAARYAVGLAKQLNINRIIVYHAWQQPVIMNAEVVSAELMNGDILREISSDNLESFKKEVEELAGPSITIEKEIDYSPVAGGIQEVCDRENISYVVMSVSGSGKFVQTVIGSNAVTTAKAIKTPVIIVPGSKSFQPIKKVLLSCDYRDIRQTLPVHPIIELLKETAAKLYVVHVDTTRELTDNIVEEENTLLHRLLAEANPEFHIIGDDKFIEAINEFSSANDIDLVIVIPKKKSFFESIFQPSRTKQLAFQSTTPMLVVHE